MTRDDGHCVRKTNYWGSWTSTCKYDTATKTICYNTICEGNKLLRVLGCMKVYVMDNYGTSCITEYHTWGNELFKGLKWMNITNSMNSMIHLIWAASNLCTIHLNDQAVPPTNLWGVSEPIKKVGPLSSLWQTSGAKTSTGKYYRRIRKLLLVNYSNGPSSNKSCYQLVLGLVIT